MPHRMHFLASSPGTGSVWPPQRPQNRCVAFHPTICFARPVVPKTSSSIPKNRPLRSRNTDPSGVEPPEGSVFRDLRGLFFGMDEDVFGTTGRAKQIVGWNATHRFCGRCGGQTEPVPGELARKCMRCGMLHYPPTTLA